MKIMTTAATLALALLAGCTAPKSASDAPTGIEARAQKRWDLLIAGKASEAFDYFSPGYQSIKDRATYATDMAQRPVRWTKALVKTADCPEGEQFCDVTVEVHFSVESTLPGVGKIDSYSPVTERWIQTEGSWYFVPKEVARNDRGLR